MSGLPWDCAVVADSEQEVAVRLVRQVSDGTALLLGPYGTKVSRWRVEVVA
ncbi:hypothetical protein AB0L05_14150 [Nonomuraea pusilla]|uniref:hypothetical protein n=1 Tax=Nonomuraea pusilla TaxID=46177 RepID=UPI00332F9889